MNRAAMMSRAPGSAFEQYSSNSQRQYETGQQMENSRLNREHQTSERLAGEDFTTRERVAGEKFTKKNRKKTIQGQRKNIKLDDKLGREREIARKGRQEDQAAKNDFDLERDQKAERTEDEELDIIHGTGPSAFKKMQEDKAELMASPSVAR